jgi:hypothetical protein
VPRHRDPKGTSLPPPRVFLEKSSELLENKEDILSASAKEFAMK